MREGVKRPEEGVGRELWERERERGAGGREGGQTDRQADRERERDQPRPRSRTLLLAFETLLV